MSQSDSSKNDRMQIRIDAYSKSKIEKAASYCHQTVSEFVTANALAAADRVLEEQEKITLSDEDWDLFYDALVNPPQPNDTLRAAFKRYTERQVRR
ncbi:MAG: DUF1778 domain-containing protein [Acidobacteriota bacterium]